MVEKRQGKVSSTKPTLRVDGVPLGILQRWTFGERECLPAGPSHRSLNQPWKFAVIRNAELKGALATMTHYHATVRQASVCIAVFLDTSRSYDRTKDVQAVGACLQNMLLTIHSMGLGGVWLGEILQRALL